MIREGTASDWDDIFAKKNPYASWYYNATSKNETLYSSCYISQKYIGLHKIYNRVKTVKGLLRDF